MAGPENRCRLVLIAPEHVDPAEACRAVEEALKGGDVASVIIPQYDLNDADFQKHAENLVPVVQAAGAAALVADNTRVAGRAKADGLHVTGGVEALAEAMEKHAPKLIVGGGNAKERHMALEMGDLQPDYVFFGKIGGDIKAEPHPKNLALGEWWSQMIEIPCVVMGGTDPGSALTVAESGADFVALREAVFADPARVAMVVAEINAALDEKAPRFGD